MADSYTPFSGRTGPFNTPLPAMIASLPPIWGHGNPESVTPAPVGTVYIDLDSQKWYQKMRGVGALGWEERAQYTQ